MKTQLLVLILCMCSTHFFFAQEDNGVVALQLPVRNSLTFNRFVINPTFSFVREQNKYISLYNKREWVQFDDAPLTYLTSYSGRFAENIGAGIGLFQQNYGVLTTFGGVVNFAYNARLARESNLTFGLNIGAYKSGINTSKVISNLSDPSVQNVPENFLLSVNPGINLGLTFLDLGISVNNLVTYNFNTSTILENNPEQSLQAHAMYTGYMDSRGFFDQTKFSGLVRSEFKKDETVISAIAMLTIPKGIWAQAGYNTVYGLSGGIGLNITQEIALEYNFEKSVGDLVDFGSSHGITLAYRLKNKENYNYSSGDEVVGLISNIKRKRSSASKISKEQQAAIQKIAEERKARILAERKAKQEDKVEKGVKTKVEAEEKAKQLAAQKAKEETEERAKQLAAQKAKEEAEDKAKQLAAQKAKEEAEERAKQLAAQKAKEEAEEKAKQLAAQKA
ncbi:PorP/SprF family type IX secretion system membrane protein, partial [Flavobacteriaceae sp. LMIT009]